MLLAQGLPGVASARRRSRRRKVVAGVVLGGVASLSLTGVAAATDRLPGRAQDVVSRVVDGLTPFHVDRKHTPADPATSPSHSRPTDVSSAPRSATVPAPGMPSSSAADDKGGGSPSGSSSGGSGSGDDDSSPSTGPSESDGGGDDQGGSTSASNREPSDPPLSPRPTRSTGDGSDGSGSGGGHDG
jgi:hypothetical protein